MHFGTKNYLKNNRYHTAKDTRFSKQNQKSTNMIAQENFWEKNL